MKQTLIIIGFLSLAFAGCGGSENTAITIEPANANIAVTESQFAGFTDANLALVEGKRLLDENQTETAIEALKHAIKLNPDLAEAYFNLGIAYALLDMQMEQSGVMIEPATNSNSKEGRKKTNSEKGFEKAVEAYKKWLGANPKDDVAHFYLGRTYAKLTKDDEAEEAFMEAVKLKPDDSEYQTELGAILIKLAQYHKAIPPLKKAIELDPANGRAIEMLEDAEAGRRRVDYISPNKNTNQVAANKASGSNKNVNAVTNSNSETLPKKTPEANTKLQKDNSKDGRPRTVSNKPAKPADRSQ